MRPVADAMRPFAGVAPVIPDVIAEELADISVVLDKLQLIRRDVGIARPALLRLSENSALAKLRPVVENSAFVKMRSMFEDSEFPNLRRLFNRSGIREANGPFEDSEIAEVQRSMEESWIASAPMRPQGDFQDSDVFDATADWQLDHRPFPIPAVISPRDSLAGHAGRRDAGFLLREFGRLNLEAMEGMSQEEQREHMARYSPVMDVLIRRHEVTANKTALGFIAPAGGPRKRRMQFPGAPDTKPPPGREASPIETAKLLLEYVRLRENGERIDDLYNHMLYFLKKSPSPNPKNGKILREGSLRNCISWCVAPQHDLDDIRGHATAIMRAMESAN